MADHCCGPPTSHRHARSSLEARRLTKRLNKENGAVLSRRSTAIFDPGQQSSLADNLRSSSAAAIQRDAKTLFELNRLA